MLQFSPEVIAKAEQYVRDGRVRLDPNVDGVYWVHGTRDYRVQTDAHAGRSSGTYIACTCPHGLSVGAGISRCSHAVAVLIAVRDGVALDVRPVLSVVPDWRVGS